MGELCFSYLTEHQGLQFVNSKVGIGNFKTVAAIILNNAIQINYSRLWTNTCIIFYVAIIILAKNSV